MIINLNLLSPIQKKELKNKRIYIALKELIMLFLLFATIIAILLLVSRYVLEQQLTELISRNAINIKNTQEISQQIIDINEKIDNVYNIQNKFKKWSDFLADVSELTPDNIAYNFIKIYHQSGIIEIQGTAETRQDLLKFQKSLKESELFIEVNVPLSNLLAKENNVFNIQAEINLEQIP